MLYKGASKSNFKWLEHKFQRLQKEYVTVEWFFQPDFAMISILKILCWPNDVIVNLLNNNFSSFLHPFLHHSVTVPLSNESSDLRSGNHDPNRQIQPQCWCWRSLWHNFLRVMETPWGVSSCFLLRIWLSETPNKPQEAQLLGSAVGVARVRDSPAYPAFLRSRGARVWREFENSSAGGESRLQEWAALGFSLSVSFRKAIFPPSKWIIATKMTFPGEEELKYGSHFLASPKGQRETIKYCSSSMTVF